MTYISKRRIKRMVLAANTPRLRQLAAYVSPLNPLPTRPQEQHRLTVQRKASQAAFACEAVRDHYRERHYAAQVESRRYFAEKAEREGYDTPPWWTGEQP